MATSLLDSLNGLVTSDFLSTAARNLGEPEEKVATALGASFPTILAGLLGKAGNSQAMRPLFDLITSPANDAGVLRNPALAAAGPAPESPLGALGGSLLSSLFGPQLSSVGDFVTRWAGLRAGSGQSLLLMAAPLVLGLLGRLVSSGGLKPAGLSSLLLGQRDQIMRAVPAGLGSVLDLTGIGRDADIGVAAPRVTTPKVLGAGGRWLWPALAALALVAVVWALARNRQPTAAEQTGAVTGAIMDTGDMEAAAIGDLRFRCGDQRVSVEQVGDRTLLAAGAESFDLRHVPTASGVRYEAAADSSTTFFWSKGDRATVVVRGQRYPECTRDR